MTIRDQILSTHETMSDLAWAAEARFREAEALIGEGCYGGAVYLAGLACEMWLKIAALRCRNPGALATTRVAVQYPPIRAWMTLNFPTIQCESYHSLSFWTEYIFGFRAMSRAALPATTIGHLRHHVVRRLFQDWKIDLRYRSAVISEQHAWRVYNDVRWVRQYRDSFWR